MLKIYKFKNNILHQINKINYKKEYIWLDITNPTNKEKKYIKKKLNQKIIQNLELFNIESSARFYQNKNGIHINTFFLEKNSEKNILIHSVAFILNNNKLYSLKEKKIKIFETYIKKKKNKKTYKNNTCDIILELQEIKIESLADEIETSYKDLETLTYVILKEQNNQKFNKSISILSKKENITSKIRICLIDTQRSINYMIKKKILTKKQNKKAKEIIKDILSLSTHNESIFEKINFLMQSAMGFLNIQQNNIIKIFSIISVIFLPPTLISSIYGMNFKYIPELKIHYSYPITLISMFIISILPYTYFKIRGWIWINYKDIRKKIFYNKV